MICPVCYGKQLVVQNGRLLPCPECAGQGSVHCCDGLQEQPGAVVPPQADTISHPPPRPAAEPAQTDESSARD